MDLAVRGSELRAASGEYRVEKLKRARNRRGLGLELSNIATAYTQGLGFNLQCYKVNKIK